MARQEDSAPIGIEVDSAVARDAGTAPGGDQICLELSLREQHLRLTQVLLVDQTDCHNELVQERQWLLHPSERHLALQGNLFVIEDLAGQSGKILIRKSPLPNARPIPLDADLLVKSRKGCGFDFALMDSKGGTENPWVVLEYRGGRFQQAEVLQAWQRSQRPATRNHICPQFVVNTWGDRSRDSRMRDSFIEEELSAAQQLGADVLQLDDGWQKGTTVNSAYAKQAGGGVWEGFWNTDPHFWSPHPERFRQGLDPVLAQARARNMEIGLWFAPDSWDNFSNWRRDAECILGLFDNAGVTHFKIDGVMATSLQALDNLKSFFKAVLEGSLGKVVFDLDITAGSRPGYFGAIEAGPVFVENRYTDWHNYWPHQTLRNLWKLSRWVDPRRLRMEFLNHARNTQNYEQDALAPSCYAPATLFATVMFSNPLGWFEASHLPPGYRESVSELVGTWKACRDTLFSGIILPLGSEPDGFSGTGFISMSADHRQGYALVFRGLAPSSQIMLGLPEPGFEPCRWEPLTPTGTIESRGPVLCADIPETLGFAFSRFTRD